MPHFSFIYNEKSRYQLLKLVNNLHKELVKNSHEFF